MSQASMIDAASGDGGEQDRRAVQLQPTSTGLHEDGGLRGLDDVTRNDFQRQLKPPSPTDWERWKPDITRRYRTQTAAMILKSLQDQGYHVTLVFDHCKSRNRRADRLTITSLKMLRDRLRAWRVSKNTKVHSTRRADEPSRQMVTPPADRPERHLLNGIDHMLDAALERADDIVPSSRPDVSLLFTFGKLAADAYHRGEPRVWPKLQQAAENVAQVDWTLITPAQHTYLLLRSMMLLRSDWYQKFQKVWAMIITHKTSPNHPQAKVTWHIHQNHASRDLWEAIFNLEQSKVLPRQTTPEQARSVAMSRHQLANLLLDYDEAARAERVLDTAIADDGQGSSPLDSGIQSEVYSTMGRTIYYRGNYVRAAHFCRLAESFDSGSDPAFTTLNANILAESLVLGGETAEANGVLDGLGSRLSHDDQALARAGPKLADLCDGLEQYEALAEAVSRLKSLRLHDTVEINTNEGITDFLGSMAQPQNARSQDDTPFR